MEMNASYTSFVAVGDSFTEGMSDLLPDGSYRGWADLLAGRLAAGAPDFRYANLAVRGKLIGQIVDRDKTGVTGIHLHGGEIVPRGKVPRFRTGRGAL